jgi:hypothetical protein
MATALRSSASRAAVAQPAFRGAALFKYVDRRHQCQTGWWVWQFVLLKPSKFLQVGSCPPGGHQSRGQRFPGRRLSTF